MMKRLPEPELMQGLLQVKAYAEADFSKSDASLISCIEEYLLKKGLKVTAKSLILDIGCGPGNITERLSYKWPTAKIFGIDGSQAMLSIARSRAEDARKKGDLTNVNYLCWDMFSIANGKLHLEKPIDLVVSNSLLHHLYDPALFWKVLGYLTDENTVNFHRDLRRPSTFENAIALQKTYLKDAPDVLVKDYLSSLRAAFTIEEVKEQINSQRLDHFEVYEIEDRYLDVVGTS